MFMWSKTTVKVLGNPDKQSNSFIPPFSLSLSLLLMVKRGTGL